MTRNREVSRIGVAIAFVSVLTLLLPVVIAIRGSPKVYVSPDHIPPDGTTWIHITVDTTTGPPSLDFLYFEVRQVYVQFPPEIPDGLQMYMLGTASVSNIVGTPIIVNIGDDIAIPYGNGVGSIGIEGTDYYWYRNRLNGAPVSPDQRLDLWPTPSPTSWSGTYEADVEGLAYYSDGSTQQITIRIFFVDIPYYFTVPEDGSLPEFGVAVVALVMLIYAGISLRNRNSKR